ncbi:MAG: hypothetical protein IKT60_05800 [Clostridia bacterium]|nr:hypothetical protein [Clostridia bacterium]
MKKRSSFTLCLALLFCLCSFSGCSDDVADLAGIYAEAVEKHMQNPASLRDPGEFQSETQELITLDGQLYQSYVCSASGLRYIFLSAEEYDMQAFWDWIAVGTEKEYSLDLLGKMDEGRK